MSLFHKDIIKGRETGNSEWVKVFKSVFIPWSGNEDTVHPSVCKDQMILSDKQNIIYPSAYLSINIYIYIYIMPWKNDSGAKNPSNSGFFQTY